nr:hypothetical protein [Tanacetum cinerariifolium]
MTEMQSFLSGSNVAVESFKLLKELQDDELEKSRKMMKLISETQLKKYEGLSLDGYIDVGGSSTCCNLVHESVVYDGPSLLHLDKDCFANDVVLDVGGSFVPDIVGYTFPLLLKKKRTSMVNVTRKRSFRNRTKIPRLGKGIGKRVECEANYRRLGSLIGLNEDESNVDPQLMTQVSLTIGSSNINVN